MAKRWQAHPSGKEIEALAWKTWEAAGNEALAEHLTCVAVLENGLKFIDNEAGLGYVGGTWGTIDKALRKRGIKATRQWIRANPWTVHQALVEHFKDFEESYQDTDKVLRVWHRGGSWHRTESGRKDADRYARDWGIVFNKYYEFKDEIKPRQNYKECAL